MVKEQSKPQNDEGPTVAVPKSASAKPHCGIIMPISEIEGCSANHWSDVEAILVEAIESADFTAELVSEAEYAGTILKRIIQHIHDDPIVVCDVSCKNANVMFELGLRLAFDRPTVIIKDDKTGYSFDTSVIEHLTYPRDLRYNLVNSFKSELAAKVRATYEEGKKEDYSPFLKHFGSYSVAKWERREVSGVEVIQEQLQEIYTAIRRIERPQLENDLINNGLWELVRLETTRLAQERNFDIHSIPGGSGYLYQGVYDRVRTRLPSFWNLQILRDTMKPIFDEVEANTKAAEAAKAAKQ